jgi:hypothetical protein
MRTLVASVALACAAFAWLASCGPSPSDEAADLCRDMGNLRGTLGFIAQPPKEATVGLIRAAVDRLDPTFTRLDAGDQIPDDVAKRLLGAQRAVRAVLDPYGDDTSITVVTRTLVIPAKRLLDAVAVTTHQLGCPSG